MNKELSVDTILRSPARIAFLCGKGAGDYFALLRARRQGLVLFESVALMTSSRDSAVLDQRMLLPQDARPVIVTGFKDARREAFAKISDMLESSRPDLIFLCGFTYVLPAGIVKRWEGKIINSHHAALPDHPGLFTKEELVAKGEAELAATLHFVDAGVDTGPVISIARFPNFGMSAFEKILRYYRFIQDVLVVQAVRDRQQVATGERQSHFADIRFEPGPEKRILDLLKADYGFA